MRDRFHLPLELDLGEAVVVPFHVAGGARSEEGPLRAVLGELPRLCRDASGRAAIEAMAAALEPALPPLERTTLLGRSGPAHSPFARFPASRDAASLVSEALRDGRLVVISISSRALSTGPMVGPQPRPPSSKPPRPPDDPLTWFEVTIVDDVGDPLADIPLRVSFLGDRRDGATDASGKLRVDRVDASFAEVRFGDVEALRDKLRPRWKRPRPRKLPQVTPLYVRELDDFIEAAAIENEVPATIALVPYFRCQEVPGTRFAYGRSFVRSDAFEQLAQIAEHLHDNEARRAMIFAHTDLSGPDALNKELSERRAKALYALLCHDQPAWDELYMNKPTGGNWSEQWGTREVQHMLNALRCPADDGGALGEAGADDARTRQAIARFQRGEYDDCPPEQAPLPDTGKVDAATRKEMFFAYAKRISRVPVPKDRMGKIGGSPFMGCGEYNPLSLSATDNESRRAVVFVYDIAAEPQGLPCKIGSLAPCKGQMSPSPAPPEEGKPPYRCKAYRDIAGGCPCNGGVDLTHDLILVFPVTLKEASALPHEYVVESEDLTIVQRRKLGADGRANDRGHVQLYFNHLPDTLRYQLVCEGTEAGRYVVIEMKLLAEYQPGKPTLADDSCLDAANHGFFGAANEKGDPDNTGEGA